MYLVLEHELVFEMSEMVFKLHGTLNGQKRWLTAILK